jgi:O-acetyl-ADP-ribose deacetylase (regulator of RNase III)
MSIRYLAKNEGLIHDDAQVLVCTTNSVGVMGAGVAKVFREQIPKLFYRYREHCKKHDPNDMVPYVFVRPSGKFVYCLHTKKQWWFQSKLEYVEKGLQAFVEWCRANEIQSAAMPPLGCGNGKLDFEKDVNPLIEKYLKESDIDVRVYCLD